MTEQNANDPRFSSAYEKRLVARLQAGEQDALAALFDMHVDRVFAFARHLLGNREDAEEVTSRRFCARSSARRHFGASVRCAAGCSALRATCAATVSGSRACSCLTAKRWNGIRMRAVTRSRWKPEQPCAAPWTNWTRSTALS